MSHVETLIIMYVQGGPTSGNVLAELCELIRQGHAVHILDSLKPYLKKEKAAVQIRSVMLLDNLVSSAGLECIQHVATDAWMDRLVRIAKQTAFPDLRTAIERLVFKWANTYGYQPFPATAERLMKNNANAVHAQGPLPGQQPLNNHFTIGPSSAPAPIDNSSQAPSRGAPVVPYQFVATASGSVGGHPTRDAPPQPQPHNPRGGGAGGRPPNASSRGGRSGGESIHPIDLLIMEVQADLAAVEMALQRPELAATVTAEDLVRDRAQLVPLLEGSERIADERYHNLLILYSTIDEMIELYNALQGSGGSEGRGVQPQSSAVRPVAANVGPPPSALMAELRAEKEKTAQKLDKAYAMNKKAMAHLGEVTGQIEARKAALKAAESMPKVAVVKKLAQDSVIAKRCRAALKGCRTVRALLSEVKTKAEKVKNEIAACDELKTAASRLPEAIERDKQAHMASLLKLQADYAAEMKLRKQLYNQIQELKGNIRVYCRVRPMVDSEKTKYQVVTTFPNDGEVCVVDSDKGKNRNFEFDQVFNMESNQEKVFEDTRPLIDSVVDGYNVCIFAYGQTGSGKTHTMSGPDNNMGINRRALGRLFEIVEERKDTETCTVEVAVLEIYNEEIRDLVRTKSEAASLSFEVKTGGETGHYVTNLSFIPVHTERLFVRPQITVAKGART